MDYKDNIECDGPETSDDRCSASSSGRVPLGANDKNQTPEQERLITRTCDAVDSVLAQLTAVLDHCASADRRIFNGTLFSDSNEPMCDSSDEPPHSATGLDERLNQTRNASGRANEYVFQLLNRI